MNEPRPRLLAVDDDRGVLTVLVAGLSRAGFDVLVATNGDEAVRVAADVRPALALVDASMEGGDGLATVRALRRETHTPAVVLASVRETGMRERALAAGALDVVAKPPDFTRLVPALHAALERLPEPLAADGTAESREPRELLARTLGGAHGPQALIALGILVERHKVNCDEAMRLLHLRAEAAGVPVDEVSLAVIEQAEGTGGAGV